VGVVGVVGAVGDSKPRHRGKGGLHEEIAIGMEKGNAIAKKGVSGEQTLNSSLGKRGEMETCYCHYLEI